ncbi:copper homeostasis protein cutC homolog [Cimex lectularius]|uniref:Copper homeostasis protein cutC homolog n=1 Tax=Cimex lectularius TaxID=79782 RepID=A0A8I6RSS7_CIMLE|nr:copper homeostasis protein cutC homolog [Cimex lectularius]XP_014250898.1 copper homeostasis protein cutC homolog [Cimex lectularius]
MEVCVDNVFSVLNAAAGGACRLEVCSALSEGGLTPTPALLAFCKNRTSIPAFCMVRLRGGGFVYSSDEVAVMAEDAATLVGYGADGLVFGALNADRTVDEDACRRIAEAGGVPLTFHRAFDEVADPWAALDTVADLGFKRILTSGQRKTAAEGLPLLEWLSKNDRIPIMPGSGVNVSNLGEILRRTGVSEFHGSAAAEVETGGGLLRVTDSRQVKDMVAIYNSFRNQTM